MLPGPSFHPSTNSWPVQFLTRRAAELGPQIESGLLLLWEDPGYVSVVSLGIVYAR